MRRSAGWNWPTTYPQYWRDHRSAARSSAAYARRVTRHSTATSGAGCLTRNFSRFSIRNWPSFGISLYDQAWDATATGRQRSVQSGPRRLGLPEGTPIAIGEFDVHYGAIASGIEEGVLVKAIGTSTCDCCVVKADKQVQDIPGICGIVKGAILPGLLWHRSGSIRGG